jgi:hypothetical protein
MDRGHILNSQTDSYSSYLGRLFQFQESDYIFMIFVYNVLSTVKLHFSHLNK